MASGFGEVSLCVHLCVVMHRRSHKTLVYAARARARRQPHPSSRLRDPSQVPKDAGALFTSIKLQLLVHALTLRSYRCQTRSSTSSARETWSRRSNTTSSARLRQMSTSSQAISTKCVSASFTHSLIHTHVLTPVALAGDAVPREEGRDDRSVPHRTLPRPPDRPVGRPAQSRSAPAQGTSTLTERPICPLTLTLCLSLL